MKHKDVAPYDELVKTCGLRWPVVKKTDGKWHETPFRFMEFSDSYVEKGKGLQFYHSVTKDDKAGANLTAQEKFPLIKIFCRRRDQDKVRLQGIELFDQAASVVDFVHS